MLYNPEAFSAEVLAGDIKRYLGQGLLLEVIHNGAVHNGVPETLWREAVVLLDVNKKSLERANKKQKNRTQKLFLFFGAMILVGLFSTFLIYQNMETLQSLNFTQGFSSTPVETEDVIATVTNVSTKTPAETKQTQSLDTSFNTAVEDGSIVVDYFGVDETYAIFSSVGSAEVFLKDLIGTYSLQSVKISFDQNARPILNDFQLRDANDRNYFVLANTITPFQFRDSTVLFHQPNSLLVSDIDSYSTADWDVFLEKVEFKSQSKKNLTFLAELIVHDEKLHFRVMYDYPDNALDSVLDVDFIPFTKGNGQRSIAFGRKPRISTGFLSKKYPIRRGPKPRSVQ